MGQKQLKISALDRLGDSAIVPPLTTPNENDDALHEEWGEFAYYQPSPAALRWRRFWVRAGLLVMAIGFSCVFAVAICLNPYREDGTARLWETHRQLQLGARNLPECSFKTMFQRPCPSCGMTTSFALFIRGDLWNSMRANWAGTFLASICFVFIPWSVVSIVYGRPWGFRDAEWWVVRLIVAFVVAVLLRWVIILIMMGSA